jgi:hypothetical protein
MKKFLTVILLLLSFSVANAQDFTFTKKSAEGSPVYSTSLTIAGDSATFDVQGYLDGNIKDFDAGSIGLITSTSLFQDTVVMTKETEFIRISVADSLTTKYSNYIDVSLFKTIILTAKYVAATGNNRTLYIDVHRVRVEGLLDTPFRFMNQK